MLTSIHLLHAGEFRADVGEFENRTKPFCITVPAQNEAFPTATVEPGIR